jgi:hypothetical protein
VFTRAPNLDGRFEVVVKRMYVREVRIPGSFGLEVVGASGAERTFCQEGWLCVARYQHLDVAGVHYDIADQA